MASIIKVDTIQDQDGNNIISEAANTITIGASGDTITIPSGATLANSGIVTGFQSTGIDDNATSTAITIDSNENVYVNGTVTADGLTVDGTTQTTIIKGNSSTTDTISGTTVEKNTSFVGSNNVGNFSVFTDTTGSDSYLLTQYNNSDLHLSRRTAPNNYKALSIDGATGDISFYEDTGTTAKFFWDTSAERLGIGTSSPSETLDVFGNVRIGGAGNLETNTKLYVANTGGDAYIQVKGADSTGTTGIKFGRNSNAVQSGMDWSASDNALKFYTFNFTERMRINSSGNVGIGTSSINAKLEVVGGQLRVSESDASSMFLVNPSTTYANGVDIQATYSGVGSFGPLKFTTGGAERMRIDSSGTFYLNTASSPTANSVGTGSIGQLVTSGDAWNMKHEVNGATMVNMWQTGVNGANAFNFHKGNAQTSVGNIYITTGGTSYNTSSDYRLKENVNYDFDATTRLKQLKPARFNFIVDADKTVDGFLAHEVSSVVPEAITGEKDAVDENGNPKYQGIDQSKLVPLLVKTIQELEARITALETNQP